ncbi:MAG: AEC family transporter [Candidatus Methanomethylicia archaeon]|jgi:predicted permease|nr:AEC family transporter [Candidatus Methanomethylicia archaeon]
MDLNIVLRTGLPIFLLIGLGYLSKKIKILRAGDERILSAYVYYFALPALFIVDLSIIKIEAADVQFVIAGIAPIFVIIAVYLTLYYLLNFSKQTLYILIVSTVFGSLAFFGLPFVIFAFPGEGEYLATLSVSSISVVSVSTSIIVLEFYKLEGCSLGHTLKTVSKKLSKNPLILSILIGWLLSLSGVKLPEFISIPLHMLGSTTATVAIFMLGAFLYGRKYSNIFYAFKLSMLRIIVLPIVALLIATQFNISGVPLAILIIMHSVPVAVSMIVLSERYNFYKEVVASLILISSLGAPIYLNLWILILGL